MARRVTVSSLGLKLKEFPAGTSYEAMVEGVWEYLHTWIKKVLCDKPDFIVLTETCDRPANLSRDERKDYYAVRGNRILEKMRETARGNNVNIAYSAVLRKDDGSYRNCTTFIGRKGEIRGTYNKNHLIKFEYTIGDVLYGKDAPVIEMDFGTVGGLICFDLNFDELREKYEKSRPELLVFSAQFHGGHVQGWWAHRCRSWFVGACSGLPCNVWNPLGIAEATSSSYLPYVTHTINLDYVLVHYDENRGKLNDLKAKYGTGVKIVDPGYLGHVLVMSETDGVSAMDMAKEFDIMLLDDYFARSLQERHTEGRMEK